MFTDFFETYTSEIHSIVVYNLMDLMHLHRLHLRIGWHHGSPIPANHHVLKSLLLLLLANWRDRFHCATHRCASWQWYADNRLR